jgi:hypothetical protein
MPGLCCKYFRTNGLKSQGNYSHSKGEWEGRVADQILDGIERMNAIQLSGVDNRSESCIGSGTPSGAETADDLAMHDRGTQVPFTDIIGRTDICTMQENEQVVPTCA